MTAKQIIIVSLVLIGLFELYDYINPQPKAVEKQIVYFKDEAAAKALLQKEQRVRGVNFEFPGIVYIGIYTKDGNENGYAETMCLTILPYIQHEMEIRIIDYKDVLQKKGWTTIGKTTCKPQ